MRILINGLTLFGRRLANDLKEVDPTSRFDFFDTYRSKWEQLRFLLSLPFADAVISMNGVTDRSGSLDAVLRLNKRLIMQWQGTDALNAMERFKKGTIDRRYIDHAVHLVDSPWLMQEVTSLELRPSYGYFKGLHPVHPTDSYKQLSAMSYIAQGRQDFYGMKRVLELARSFPEVEFNIYGTASTDYPIPGNVTLRGWVEPAVFVERLRETPLFLRLTEHEGFPVSVIEAMAYGSEVLMSMPYEPVFCSRSTEGDSVCFRKMIDRLQARAMRPNRELIAIAARDFNKELVMKKYFETLQRLLTS